MKVLARILITMFGLASASCAQNDPEGNLRKVDVAVVDESGNPIVGVNVEVVFVGATALSAGQISGITDAHGRYSASGRPDMRIQVAAQKQGYYPYTSGRMSKSEDHQLRVVLRKITSPTALYAKRVVMGVPKHAEWIGYDFEAGDWVAPHGNGKHADVHIRTRLDSGGNGNGSGDLEFQFKESEGLAIVESAYLPTSRMKLPHEAPENSYVQSLSRHEDSYHNRNAREHIGYFFRTRAQHVDGRLVSACYGKLLGDVRFDPRKSGWHVEQEGQPTTYGTISFTYYFNPAPNDRNLEFDPEKNLFKNLENEEEVREP